MEKEYMTVTANGEEHRCEILFTYFSEEYKHNYVVFAVEGTEEISAMIFTEDGEQGGQLFPIENDEEWEMLEDVLQDWFEKQESGCSCGCCSGDCDCECGEDEECSCHCHE